MVNEQPVLVDVLVVNYLTFQGAIWPSLARRQTMDGLQQLATQAANRQSLQGMQD